MEVIKIQDIKKAYERMLRSDVKYRFVIDEAILKGPPWLHTKALVEDLLKLYYRMIDFPEIEGIDINPVMAAPAKKAQGMREERDEPKTN